MEDLTEHRLNPVKYTPVSHGVNPHKDGYLLRADDIIDAIDIILDHDDLVVHRLNILRSYLISDKP